MVIRHDLYELLSSWTTAQNLEEVGFGCSVSTNSEQALSSYCYNLPRL